MSEEDAPEDAPEDAVKMTTDELRETFEEAGMVEEAEEWREEMMEHMGKIEDQEEFQMNIVQGNMEAAWAQMDLTPEEGESLMAEWREKANQMAEEAGVFDSLSSDE